VSYSITATSARTRLNPHIPTRRKALRLVAL
jgi:hypothetical protein